MEIARYFIAVADKPTESLLSLNLSFFLNVFNNVIALDREWDHFQNLSR